MRYIFTSFLAVPVGGSVAFSQDPLVTEFGPFDFGTCLDCEDAFFAGKTTTGPTTVQAEFEEGDFKGIWGTGGVAVLMFETDAGGATHINLGPNEQATVKVWLTRGTSLNPGDPDFVGIWGTGGTYIPPEAMRDLYLDPNTTSVDGGVVAISEDLPGDGRSDLVFTIDTSGALVVKDSGN